MKYAEEEVDPLDMIGEILGDDVKETLIAADK